MSLLLKLKNIFLKNNIIIHVIIIIILTFLFGITWHVYHYSNQEILDNNKLPLLSELNIKEIKNIFLNYPLYTLSTYYMFIYTFYKISEKFFYLQRNKIWNKYITIINRNILYISIIIWYSHYFFNKLHYNGIFSISISFIIILGIYYFSKWFTKLNLVKEYLNIQPDKWFENKKVKEKILVGKTDKKKEVQYIYNIDPDVILNQNEYNNLVKIYKTTDAFTRGSLEDIEKPENYTKAKYEIPEELIYKEEFIDKKEIKKTKENIPFDFTLRITIVYILFISFINFPLHQNLTLYTILSIFLFTNIYGDNQDIKGDAVEK